MPISYVRGDVTRPQRNGPTVLVHLCNDVGAFGAGVSGSIGRRWPEVEKKYRQWHADRSWKGFGLGRVQFVLVEAEFWVANLVGQRGLPRKGKPPPVDYEAIELGLEEVADFAVLRQAHIVAPRLGCGLARGRWEEVLPCIEKTLLADDLDVTIYDLEDPPR